MTRLDIRAAVDIERARQDIVHPRRFESGSDGLRLAVLIEEVGEVGTAIQDRDRDTLRTELVQVAAVCVRWLEALTGEGPCPTVRAITEASWRVSTFTPPMVELVSSQPECREVGCEVTIPDAAVEAFKAAWHAADDEGRAGERVRAGLTAAAPHIAAQALRDMGEWFDLASQLGTGERDVIASQACYDRAGQIEAGNG